jgi:hypothetical protein
MPVVLDAAVHLATATVLAEEAFECQSQVVALLHGRDSTSDERGCRCVEIGTRSATLRAFKTGYAPQICCAKSEILGLNTFLSFKRCCTAHVLISGSVSRNLASQAI